MTEPVRESGWYRVGEHGWEPISDDVADAEIGAGGGWDLVHVDTSSHTLTADPLF